MYTVYLLSCSKSLNCSIPLDRDFSSWLVYQKKLLGEAAKEKNL